MNPNDFMKHLNALGLTEEQLKNQDPKDIKKAYHKLAQQHHPDKEGGDAEKFKEVHHAYKMLTDPSYRLSEDKRANGQGNLNAIINLTLSFEQAFFGDDFTLTFTPVHLDATGKPVKINKDTDVHLEVDVIKVHVPEGTKNGDQKSLGGKGLIQGDRRGDLIFCFNVTPHPKYRLQGSDVVSKEPIELDTMLTGGDIELQTLWGLKTIRIPAGTKPDDSLKIPNSGVAQVGHHYIEVQPKFPEKDDLKQKDIWRKLGINWKDEEDKDTEEEQQEKEFEDVFIRLGGFSDRPSGATFRFNK